jgi:hypothetical protein
MINISSWFGSDEQQYVTFTFGNSSDCNKFFDGLGITLKNCLVSADDLSFTLCWSNLMLASK